MLVGTVVGMVGIAPPHKAERHCVGKKGRMQKNISWFFQAKVGVGVCQVVRSLMFAVCVFVLAFVISIVIEMTNGCSNRSGVV